MSAPKYPEPVLTEVNRPLIEGWRRGELHMQRCGSCERWVFFPRELCPHCWCAELDWVAVEGTGAIVSYALVYSHVTAPFASESPIVFAEVMLTGGGVMLARVVTQRPDAIASGTRVKLIPLPEAARYPLPTFCVAS